MKKHLEIHTSINGGELWVTVWNDKSGQEIFSQRCRNEKALELCVAFLEEHYQTIHLKF